MSIEYRAPGVPGGEVSPGAGSTGFSSRAVPFVNSSGQLTATSTGMVWDSTQGFLGINTTTPAAHLSINSTLANGPRIILTNGSTFSMGALLNTSDVLISNQGGALTLSSTVAVIIGSDATGNKVGFYGSTGTTRPAAYTAAGTTATRATPTTVTTGTQTTADVKALQNAFNDLLGVVNNMVKDDQARGWRG